MSGLFAEGFRVIAQYREVIAFAVPAVSLSITMPSLFLMPRGKAKGLITGAYMLQAALGGHACCLRCWASSKVNRARPWSR